MTSDELTVVEAIAILRDRGFTADVHVAHDPPGLTCARCGHSVSASNADVLEVYRFEGASDPDDEAIVAALRCTQCGALGTLVAGYGINADADEASVLTELAQRRRP
jgi:ferredoxin